jgi:hypothetical protein
MNYIVEFASKGLKGLFLLPVKRLIFLFLTILKNKKEADIIAAPDTAGYFAVYCNCGGNHLDYTFRGKRRL